MKTKLLFALALILMWAVSFLAQTQTGPRDGRNVVASGYAALGTAQIASGQCAAPVVVPATGVRTTDTVSAGFNSDVTGVAGFGVSGSGAVLSIYPYPGTGTVNFAVCNSTGGPITPGSITLNWRVLR